MLVHTEIPAMWNGVSQQSDNVRAPTQCAVEINCWPTVVDGLAKRPPTAHLSLLTDTSLSSAHIHTINRDVANRFIVVLTDGDLKVFDLEGNEQTVNFPYGKDYLDVADALTEFACVTVADYTFIVNKTVPVQMLGVGDDATAQPEDYWWLNRQQVFSEFTESALAVAARRQYEANKPGGEYKGYKQSFEALADEEAEAEDGDIWRIQGTAESGFSTYYVRRAGAVWEETVAPGLRNALDAETMPWALVHRADGEFEFGPFSWAPRRMGDEDTNPNPTFVGRTIQDVFFYKNRLGFAVGEGVVCSRIGDYGNFYRMTVLALLPDDVLDLPASETKVTKINHAVPFNTGMMMFSEQVQFRVTEGETFGPGTAGLKPATQYPMKTTVKPLGIGTDVYYVVENGEWAHILEYFVKENQTGNDAANITGHVPKYIPAGVRQLEGSAVHDVLFAITSGAASRVYVYKFYWADPENKVQSAWGHWQFDSDVSVLALSMLDNDLYLVIQRADGAYLEKVSLAAGAVAPGLDFQLFLDRRYAVTGTWLEGEGKTEFELPYPVAEDVRDTFRIVRGPDFDGAEGAILSVEASGYEWVDSTHVKVETNFTDGECFVGKVYEQRRTFSKQYMRDRQGTALVEGTYSLRNYGVYFTQTAYFRVEVQPYGPGMEPDTVEYLPSTSADFSGQTIGSAALVLGRPSFVDGKFTAGVYGDGSVAVVSIVNDSPYAATFTTAEVEAFWNKRGRVIS